MADKSNETKPERTSGARQWLKEFLKAADLPADLTVIGILGYALTHGLFGIGAKKEGGGNVSVKGVSDEAGFQWLLVTLKKLGGIYGEQVSKTLSAIHTVLFNMDHSTAEIFRGILLSNLKEENLDKFFKNLLDAMPKSIHGKQERLRAHLAGHEEPHIMFCIELHKQVEVIRNREKVSLEEASAILVQEALKSGEIPASFTLQGKKKLDKALSYLNNALDQWSQSLEKRREEDPSRVYFDENSLVGSVLSARVFGAFVKITNGKASINIVGMLAVTALIIACITILLQKS